MNPWHEDPDELDHRGVFDPLCVERSAPIEDEEAAMVEALCQAATPGPLVVDDEVEGEGAVVVSLPDGRLIVSLTVPVEHTQGEEVSRANARTAVDWLTAAGIPAGRHEHAFTVVLPRPPEPFLDTWPLAVDGDWAHIICMPGKSLDDVHRFVGDYVAVMQPPQLSARPVPIPPTRQPTPAPHPELADLKDPIAC